MKILFILFIIFWISNGIGLPKMTPYSESLATTLMTYCKISYCDDEIVNKWACGESCDILADQFEILSAFHNSTSKCHGFVGYDKSMKSVLLVFAGTDHLQEWINNLKYPKTVIFPICPYENCGVHEGFLEMFLSVSDQVHDLITKAFSLHPDASLTLAGHSLGAALAILAAVDFIHFDGIQAQTIYTFGKPRVGNQPFSDWATEIITADMYRVTHHRDPVPHLPPEMMDFTHTPTEIFYKGDVKDGYIVCVGDEDKKCSDQYYFDLTISDHTSYMNLNTTKNC